MNALCPRTSTSSERTENERLTKATLVFQGWGGRVCSPNAAQLYTGRQNGMRTRKKKKKKTSRTDALQERATVELSRLRRTYRTGSSLKEGFKAQKTSQGRTNSPKAAVSAVSPGRFLSVAVSQDQTNVHFFVALSLVSFFFFFLLPRPSVVFPLQCGRTSRF